MEFMLTLCQGPLVFMLTLKVLGLDKSYIVCLPYICMSSLDKFFDSMCIMKYFILQLNVNDHINNISLKHINCIK